MKYIKPQIVLEKGLLKKLNWIEQIRSLAPRAALVTDSNLFSLAKLLQAKLNQHLPTTLLLVASGEHSKTRSTKERIEDEMQTLNYGKDTLLIALGGGMILDLAGFVAATYCRGIPFVSLPTSLTGMVDACLGGKVAVNTNKGKNLIGTYYNPHFIFIDVDTLCTLPPRHWLDGFVEIIKYSLIASSSLFKDLQRHIAFWQAKDLHWIHKLIQQSLAIKDNIVTQDPFENGLRRILNFGHTFGHALEAASDYILSHGEAVALGMRLECLLSWQMGYLSSIEWQAIQNLFDAYQLPGHLPDSINFSELIDFMQRDKKATSKHIRCVALQKIGSTMTFEGTYCTSINTQQIETLFEQLHVTA